jgi:hypothetical protein
MTALWFNQTLSFADKINPTAISSPIPTSAEKTLQWDAVAVSGFIFGLLAVLLAAPGAYLAIIALKSFHGYDARQS